MVIVWVLLIAGSVGLIKALFSDGMGKPAGKAEGAESAADILDKRYARGELSREEYETIRADLLKEY